ncbi:DUF2971 domain-containing protein [Salmonella enterica]|uniref:DUF2971 domain-containing protein n=4 Tax=Salmonella enterica TaxID=28901 RepID=A0A5T3Z8U9_SALER|nr:DUF2971 domain-containing protein [Salmonella enterica]ECC9834545.1 DUF2971 domain-containing protein [Salmonella enterica subsp. enterica serovar Paratyphi A]EDE4792453.1 DUF2971 domain-containing protein [Salmonella enterica subsp. enterica serovar Enteritidis]EDG8911295.1 DUF2971 domain-containing protein [Salmonella enterica subsp. enterica serovar Typhimurium]EDY0563042.1 DUF2971 domain-containing protein [Salmonella enterica subsp. enterica]HAD7831361.1 DUF2971 domain-containing prote
MLYKYVGNADDDKVIEYLDAFVENGTIYASRPLDFNDPAELKVILDFEADFDVIKNKFYADNPEKTEEEFLAWYSSFDERAKSWIAYKTREEILTTHGIVCLTRDHDNFLMWSHYANSHTGFCIGFDDEFSKSIEGRSVLGNVVYVDFYPRYNYYTDDPVNYLSATYLHKGLPWSYEKEYRVITDGYGVKRFDKSLIKEVTLGCRASFELQDHACKLIEKGISVFKMALGKDSYKLERVPVKKNHYFQGDA